MNTDQEIPTITANIYTNHLSSNTLSCTIPLYGMAIDSYKKQIKCFNDEIEFQPKITYSKDLIKPIDSYSYDEILNFRQAIFCISISF